MTGRVIRSRGRLFTLQPGQAVRGARGPAADAVPGPVEDAGRRQPPDPKRRQGRFDRRGGGVRLRGRIQPGIQEGDRAGPRRLARNPPHRQGVVPSARPDRDDRASPLDSQTERIDCQRAGAGSRDDQSLGKSCSPGTIGPACHEGAPNPLTEKLACHPRSFPAPLYLPGRTSARSAE